jgi:hypothetical protein
MTLLKFLNLVILVLNLTTLRAFAAPVPVNPVEIDSADLQDYRRIWGSPSGCFYFLRHNDFEIRQYAQNKTMSQVLGPNQKLISSEQGSYFALLTYSSFSPTSLHVTDAKLYDCTGQLVWDKRDPGCTSFILSDRAPIAVGVSGAEGMPESWLTFFGATGQETGTAKIDNFSSGRFSESADYFFGISAGKGLIKYTSSGKEVSRYTNCSRYSISRDGEMVAEFLDTMVTLYKGQALMAIVPALGITVRDVRFSYDNRYAAILMKQRLQLLDVDSAQTVWDYLLPDSGFQFFHFDSDSAFTYFACSTNNSTDAPERRNTLGQALLLDSEGKLVWQTETSYVEWSVKYPEVKIDLAARIMTLLTADRFRVYSF